MDDVAFNCKIPQNQPIDKHLSYPPCPRLKESCENCIHVTFDIWEGHYCKLHHKDTVWNSKCDNFQGT